jgi:hypothetical protein
MERAYSMSESEILVREPEGKRLLGFCGHRQGNDNEMDVSEMGFVGVDWIHLVLDRLHLQVLVNTARYH